MKPHMNRDVFHTKDVFFKRAAKICAAVRFRPDPCPKRFKSGDTHLEVHASNVWNISIIQHQSNFKGKVAFVKQNRTAGVVEPNAQGYAFAHPIFQPQAR